MSERRQKEPCETQEPRDRHDAQVSDLLGQPGWMNNLYFGNISPLAPLLPYLIQCPFNVNRVRTVVIRLIVCSLSRRMLSSAGTTCSAEG